ncbi:Membrane primary amine oxidase [Lecanosticta acicola]|uniref:Amine oxidase n=1 Tax=Lecanosticta acicola TaxID=111012 RepID=A0AAI8W0A5_9PEZI|nr:Membrane primary amine oxidase [Lecanosticta acicola]
MDLENRKFFIICSILFFTAIISWVFLPVSNLAEQSWSFATAESPFSFKAPKPNIWSELTEDETREVYNFVAAELPDLNLVTRPENGVGNFTYTVETLRPNKTDAISYLYGDDHSPERWAKLVLGQSINNERYLVYYAVGPLPISESSTVTPLEYPFRSGKNMVKSPILDYFSLSEFGDAVGRNVSDITRELLGAAMGDDGLDALKCWPRTTTVTRAGLVLWFQFFRSGQGSGGRTLLPQGLYFKANASSSDKSDWSVEEWFYNGKIYASVEEFRNALDTLQRTPANLDGDWTETEDFDSSPPGRELPPPVSVQPFGTRYKLDRKEKFVSWFGFEFYITTSQATGLALFDIRFKGQRVMYELGLQEAMAHYAGDDPMAGGQEFLDTFFGMGKNMFELVPGYDCPAYADYMDTQYHMLREVHELPSSICIFEYTADHLLSRHTTQYSVTASRNTYLVVRSVSTVGNYDYAIDYIFYMDGTIETKVRASGYIFAAFYRANKTEGEDEYGHRIGEAVSSSVHDHVINFKADLDVAGPRNDMIRLALEPTTKSYNWDLPEVKERNTMHLVEYPVDAEIGLDWPKNSGEFYIVYSADEKNAFGERRGYRITSGTGLGATPHLTILNSTTLGDSARWAEHDLWVLRNKEHEPRSADPLNYLTPHDPVINFNNMADHESLEHGASGYDGDLVIYFNVGSHHIPHSGDVPNTLMHTSASSVMFVPHNFHDRDPSRESVQGVRLQLNGKKHSGGFAGEQTELRTRSGRKTGAKAHYFGATYRKDLKLDLEAMEPRLEAYRTSEHDVTHLTFNGSAAGIWFGE